MIVFYQIDGKGEWTELDASDDYDLTKYYDREQLLEDCAHDYYSSKSGFYFDIVVAKAPGGEVIAKGDVEVEIEFVVGQDWDEEDDE